MKEDKTLLKEIPLTEFFMERVQTAMSRHQVIGGSMVEFYLVNLLQEFHKSEKLFQTHGSKMMEKPLALILAEALESDLYTKIRCLKQLGDLSLYTAGFFSERIKRKLIDMDYYIRMGGGAYHNLSALLNRQKTFAELYSDLGNLFPSLVDVLAEVAAQSHGKSNQDLLKLYERWLTTGNEFLKKLLDEEGIQTEDRTFLNKVQ